MNIGFFYVPYYPLQSGRSVHGYQLVKGLKQRGHTILSCLGDANPDCLNFERTKAGALKLSRRADVLYIRIAGIPVLSFLEKATLLKLIRPWSLPVVWEINAPVEELRGSLPEGREREELFRSENRKRKRLAKLVDAAVGVSNVLTDYIHDELGIMKARCIPNGSDPKLFESQNIRETALWHLRDRFKVCWMGNSNSSWQGVEMILETATKMQQLDPEIVFIIFTGESSRRFPVLKNLFVMKEVPYRIFPNYLAAADVCLCLYHQADWMSRGFYFSPLKLFDYMAAGKPIIASDMGQIAEVIRDGENGLLVDNSTDAIITRIRELKTDTEKRRKLGCNARKAVIDYYNWDRVAEETEAVLMEVCKEKQR